MGGLEDIHRGIDLALEQGSVILAALGRNELSIVLAKFAGPAEALQELELGVALARRSGMLALAESIEVGSGAEILYRLGTLGRDAGCDDRLPHRRSRRCRRTSPACLPGDGLRRLDVAS